MIRIVCVGDVLIIMLNWFEWLNVVLLQMFDEIGIVIDNFDGVCVVLFYGEGCVFCLGVDFVGCGDQLIVWGEGVFQVLINSYNLMMFKFLCLFVFIVSVISGLVVGIGCSFVFVADFCFMGESVYLL